MIKAEDVVKNPYLIISVIGPHAGEGIAGIFLRKQQEIKNTGKSYWLIQSHKATTQQVQDLCKKAEARGYRAHCVFIEPTQRGGARATSHSQAVKLSSSDNRKWENIPDGIKITGKISKNSTGLVFDVLEVFNPLASFDVWQYSEFGTKEPMKTMLGASTVCCERIYSPGMKKRYREIIGVGRLAPPYGLWLR
ncbi:MAG: hypothetical protein A3D67_04310 [Candidatus Lloydbacteria bacterium RIFCSPHIGHO2_02_FULL_51_22]|uniref:Uncharacterized protein n=3 Tax=Candidatus Lloydiibacteriota TaxID=1817910 RepID=A0A1G2DI99_9BACT|nr:MAG: hypothetical protein A3D67_04310 [Candidatus Lloydbacteria bacterium RIFCSPHIGHO2_02_FULL_51_22]OGZ14436.1 MAG: hypothetical protein A3J08_04150 [Candidatus Lloydbacteria bacterium RIFCSPLOWO2_02_FULL_51_11]OGZ17020.1 MAG: hypothetical protein A3G11_02695 [Candidatus Lloydbacteria bacterium RIFCSPLOWO2_12_FULL_51_9]